jgi:cathepsin X
MNYFVLICLASFTMAFGLSQGPGYIFWGNSVINGKSVNFLPPIRNQNQPKICDSSFAFAATSVMSTLFNIKTQGAFPEVVLSPQQLINLLPDNIPFNCTYGSLQGKIEDVLEHLKNTGVADESCNNYHADDAKDKSELAKCKDCHGIGADQCEPIAFRSYKLKTSTKIESTNPDAAQRITELTTKIIDNLNKGPLLCKITHSEKIFEQQISSSELFVDDPNLKQDYTTWVSLVGYSTLADGKTIAFGLQHSFGENVGYYGLIFLPADGKTNSNEVLENCYILEADETPAPVTSRSVDPLKLFTDKGVKRVRKTDDILNQGLELNLSTKTANEGLTISDDITPINWQNKDGINYLTYVKNQHIPNYCGSCWAQAAVSVLSDRLNIQRIDVENKPFPKFNLSVQALINCKMGGSCYGGDPSLVFQKAQGWRVPSETCETYQATNPADFTCPASNICALKSRDKEYTPKFNGVTVSKWGRARGAPAIKEALKTGPVVCDLQITADFKKYKRIPNDINIWNVTVDFININHSVSVVGWGKKGDVEYWIGRNSWGREWGYDGFFYIQAGDNILGIESECSWAEVTFESFDK